MSSSSPSPAAGKTTPKPAKVTPKTNISVSTTKSPTTSSTGSSGSRPTSAKSPASASVTSSVKSPSGLSPPAPKVGALKSPSPKSPASARSPGSSSTTSKPRPASATKGTKEVKEAKEAKEVKEVKSPSAPKPPISVDVVVIGAGFSGVSTAMNLCDTYNVNNFVVINPEERLGGRNYSYEAEIDVGKEEVKDGKKVRVSNVVKTGFRFEHGAQYVGDDQKKLNALWARVGNPKEEKVDGYAIREMYLQQVMLLNHKLYSYDRDDVSLKIGGVPPGLLFFDLMSVLLMVQEIQGVSMGINVLTPWADPSTWNPAVADMRSLDFLSMAQFLNLAPIDPSLGMNRDWVTNTAASLIQVACQAVLSVEATEMSALFFLWYCCTDNGFLNVVNDEKGGPQQYYHKYGFNKLLDDWFKPMKEKLAVNKVTQIDTTTKHAVKVTCADGQVYVAKQVVVATTPRAAFNTIKFNPVLNDGQNLVLNQSMGRTIKCQIFYKTQWWNDSMCLSYTGYAGAVSYPVTWIMDYSPASLDPSVASKPGACCLMTFTVGHQCDILYANGKRPTKRDIEILVTQGVATLLADLRALWTSSEYIDLIYHEWVPEADGGDPCLPGGPNTILPLGGLFSGDNTNPEGPAASFLQYQPINDSVVFCCAEFAKKIDATLPDGWPVIDGDGNITQFSDAREALGYMDGAICAGEAAAQVVAAQLGAPAVANETKSPPPPAPTALAATPTKPSLYKSLVSDTEKMMGDLKKLRTSAQQRLIQLADKLKSLALSKKNGAAAAAAPTETKTADPAPSPSPPSYTQDQLFVFLSNFIAAVNSETAAQSFPTKDQTESDWWDALGRLKAVEVTGWLVMHIAAAMAAAGMDFDQTNPSPYLEELVRVGIKYTFPTLTTSLNPDGSPVTKTNPNYDAGLSMLSQALNLAISERLALLRNIAGPQSGS